MSGSIIDAQIRYWRSLIQEISKINKVMKNGSLKGPLSSRLKTGWDTKVELILLLKLSMNTCNVSFNLRWSEPLVLPHLKFYDF